MKHKLLIVTLILSIIALLATIPIAQALKEVQKSPFQYTEDFDTGMVIFQDFTKGSVSVKDGARVTVGQPTTFKRTVWVFGNSMLVAEELSDAETLPSVLQSQFSACRFVNAGMLGISTNAMRVRLRLFDIKPGDMVIMLSGYMEAYYQQMTPTALLKDALKAKADVEVLGATFVFIVQPYDFLDRETSVLFKGYRETFKPYAWAHDMSTAIPADGWLWHEHLSASGTMVLAEKVNPLVAPFCE